MREYLIEVPHSAEECPFRSAEPRHRPDAPPGPLPGPRFWGCRSGVHTSWLIADLPEGLSEEQAWTFVPALLRDTARVIHLDREQGA